MDRTAELELEVKALRDRLKKLEDENYSLKRVVSENDLDEEVVVLSDEEQICVNEIRKLKQLSDAGQFGKNEALVLDILYKNLRIIRGMSEDRSGKKNKKADVKELFKIIEGK